MNGTPAESPGNADRALALSWAGLMEAWVGEHGLAGYDRFDVRGHPILQRLQPYRLLRRASSGLVEFFPHASRRLLGIRPQLNAKAFALVALASLRRYQATGREGHLARALEHLEWLRAHPSPGFGDLCWGYPFDVSAKGFQTPRHTPVVVVCAIAGEAFALAFAITGDEAHAEACRSIALFILRHIPRMDAGDGTICFAYTPGDTRRVHNASLHAAAHLMRAFRLTGDASLHEAARPAVEFTLRRQRPDGSWPYGEFAAGEPFEAQLLNLVDHHHTGFVLRSLFEIHQLAPSEPLRNAILRGYDFYRERLFEPDGCPRTLAGRFPVDIHACAEGILCPSVLSVWKPEALVLASRTLRWTAENMRDGKTGVPYYRMYPWFVSKLYCPRWSLSWMYYALCQYLYCVEPPLNATWNRPKVSL